MPKNSSPAWARRLAAILGTSAALCGPHAHAQTQTDRPVRIILPTAPASGIDYIVRAAQPALSAAFGQTIVVENQPGAGGILGTSAIVKAAPDGNTLGVVSNNHVIFPSVYKSVPFDPVNDITAIAVIGSTPLVLVVNPKLPARNASELIALLRADPGKYNYASSGNGTILHLAAEMFLQQAGVSARHIPYKGVGPMLNDLIGGQVEFGVVSLPSAQPHIRSGALRAIGVGADRRVAAAPDIPTMVEQGMPDYRVEGWFGAIGPKGMAPDDVQRIHGAIKRAYESDEVRAAMDRQGNTIEVSSSAEAAAFFRSEMAKYAALVEKARIELQ